VARILRLDSIAVAPVANCCQQAPIRRNLRDKLKPCQLHKGSVLLVLCWIEIAQLGRYLPEFAKAAVNSLLHGITQTTIL
jgi:hypothetical protein